MEVILQMQNDAIDSVAFSWNGHTSENLKALGRDLLEKLWNKDEEGILFYKDLLESRAISMFLVENGEVDGRLYHKLQQLNFLYRKEKTKRSCLKNMYIAAYEMSECHFLYVDENTFRTLEELENYCEDLLAESFEKYAAFAERLIGFDGEPDVQFESWLICHNKADKLRNLRQLQTL